MEHAIMLGGFILIELCFQHAERACEHYKGKLKSFKHASYLVWILHPAALSGMDEWIRHVFIVTVSAVH